MSDATGSQDTDSATSAGTPDAASSSSTADAGNAKASSGTTTSVTSTGSATSPDGSTGSTSPSDSTSPTDSGTSGSNASSTSSSGSTTPASPTGPGSAGSNTGATSTTDPFDSPVSVGAALLAPATDHGAINKYTTDITWTICDRLVNLVHVSGSSINSQSVRDTLKTSTTTGSLFSMTRSGSTVSTTDIDSLVNCNRYSSNVGSTVSGFQGGVSMTGVVVTATASGTVCSASTTVTQHIFSAVGTQTTSSVFGDSFSDTRFAGLRVTQTDYGLLELTVGRSSYLESGGYPTLALTDLIRGLGPSQAYALLDSVEATKNDISQADPDDILNMGRKLAAMPWHPGMAGTTRADYNAAKQGAPHVPMPIEPTLPDSPIPAATSRGTKVNFGNGNQASISILSEQGRSFTIGSSTGIVYGNRAEVLSGQRGVSADSGYEYFRHAHDQFSGSTAICFSDYYQIGNRPQGPDMLSPIPGRVTFSMTRENRMMGTGTQILFVATDEDIEDPTFKDPKFKRLRQDSAFDFNYPSSALPTFDTVEGNQEPRVTGQVHLTPSAAWLGVGKVGILVQGSRDEPIVCIRADKHQVEATSVTMETDFVSIV